MRRLLSSILATCFLLAREGHPRSLRDGRRRALRRRFAHPTQPPTRPATFDERRRQLTALLDEHWQYVLRTSPVYASRLGDRRSNDRWGDDSLQAIAADLIHPAVASRAT